MKNLYLVFIFKLSLNNIWGEIQITKIENRSLPKEVSTEAVLLHPSNSQRIIGGYPVNIEQYPFVAFFMIILPGLGWNFRGGATIVGEYWGMTAAHCVQQIPDSYIKDKKAFLCGNTSHWKKGCNRHYIVRTYVHEKHKNSLGNEEYDYDIALVRIKNPFNGKFEKPIKWANSNDEYPDNAAVTVLGWGSTRRNAATHSDVLHAVTIRLVNHNVCKKKYRTGEVTNSMVCAIEKGKDACMYDSGGPLIRNNILIGIVSWGPEDCATDHLPGVYTKVSFFSDWLRRKMNNNPRSA
ncbi:hypothetical protein ILUMI_05963 [Ignelater luminosus]|uniref:Peptidase S1 domain-containing protein n=1 Tax=Ignelater luminosus TaxID=2038154 RepID=A0A8K0GHN7_IGNLU|nr:hypothetical protein ILUMI_05963 [Ignelater luminosus]